MRRWPRTGKKTAIRAKAGDMSSGTGGGERSMRCARAQSWSRIRLAARAAKGDVVRNALRQKGLGRGE